MVFLSKNLKSFGKVFYTLLVITITILFWEEYPWLSILFGIIIGGTIYVIIKEFLKIIFEKKEQVINPVKDDFLDFYDEDMNVINAFSQKCIEAGERMKKFKKDEYDHSLERIKLAFERMLSSPYLTDDKIKESIKGLENHFYLIYYDKHWDRDYKEELKRLKLNDK